MKGGKFTALLGVGSEYEGVLRFKGAVHIEGMFTGEIVSDGRLVVGKGAKVKGTIKVAELIVTGSVEGDMEVTRLTHLYRDAEVVGSLVTERLAMEEGALLQGQLTMREVQEHQQDVAPSPQEAVADMVSPQLKQ